MSGRIAAQWPDSGYQSMRRVYRDPETGRMLLIGEDE